MENLLFSLVVLLYLLLINNDFEMELHKNINEINLNNLSQYLENGVSMTPKRRFISFIFLCKILLFTLLYIDDGAKRLFQVHSAYMDRVNLSANGFYK